MAILIVIATVAFVVTPPGPPALAEFAPRAEERIDEALKSQSSSFGDGDGLCAAGQACAAGGEGGGGAGSVRSTTTTTQEVIERARVKRCVGDPPRQTEDPQSPPCIGYWEGDNGGATAKGVTRDEIRVVFPRYAGADAARELVEHFNRRYQLYGRKIRVITVASGADPKFVPEQADEVDAFAALKAYNDWDNLDAVEFHREAARRGIVSGLGHSGYTSSAEYRSLEPYAWSYGPPIDEVQAEAASFICSSLGTRAARFAGNELKLAPRKYAVVIDPARGRPVDFSPLNNALRRCGVEAARVYTTPSDATTAAGIYRSLQSDGVTSIVLFAPASRSTYMAKAAPPKYQPEWIVTGVGTHDNEAQWFADFPASRRSSLFGVFMLNKLLRAEETPSAWAYADAGAVQYWNRRDHAWYEPAWDYEYNMAYRALLMLASGIQMAGPRLTPETFAAGLRKAQFPNPGADGPPYYQAHVGFGPGDYGMTDGAAAVWWSDATESYGGAGLTRKGGWCYVRSGARFHAPSWPDVENELFNPDHARCR